ncbi:MAG: DUF1249 domain-containing protein [Gammaproteobacteria bacterium]|nr:DUF1249 domain-containing protein [Gammaproteobacteria bacterium]
MSHSIAEHRQRSPMWMYEKNFVLLNNLCPTLDSSDFYECLQFENNTEHRLSVRVTERCRYTMMLELTQNLVLSKKYSQLLKMQVRLYFDAGLAEVTNYQGFECVLAKYRISKKGMEKEEKRQVNILLHDWLSAFYSRQLKQRLECV